MHLRIANSTQTELNFARIVETREKKRAVARRALPILEGALRDLGPRTRAEFARYLGWSERRVRLVAAESRIILRAPGVRCYRLLDDATAAEIYGAINHIRAQMREEGETLAHYLQVAGLKVALAAKTEPAPVASSPESPVTSH